MFTDVTYVPVYKRSVLFCCLLSTVFTDVTYVPVYKRSVLFCCLLSTVFTDVTYVPVYKRSVLFCCLLSTVFTDVTYVPVYKRSGRVEAVDIIAAVRPNTIMVTVMLANNETGVIQVHITAPFLPQYHHGDCDVSKQ